MIRMAREMDKVVITATQMMESMIVNPVPTRAEVSDVANAVLDGTDAVMLSAETAAGKYPVETITQMAAIALEAEAAEDVTIETDFTNKKFGRIDQSIAMGALFTAHHLGCKAILALTESGSTALWMSRHNVKVPIFGLTTQLVSQRKMTLYRNVRPLLMPGYTDRDQALAAAEKLLVERGVLRPGDTYAITCGEPMGYPGGTNMPRCAGSRDHDVADAGRGRSRRAASARRGGRHALPAFAHAVGDRRLRGGAQVREPPVHRLVQGARRAQQDGAAERGRTRQRRARRLGRQPRAGRGLPRAARMGVPATIVMPRFAPAVKVENTRRFGATVVLGATPSTTHAPAASRSPRNAASPSCTPTTISPWRRARARSRSRCWPRSRSSTRWWLPSAAAG